MPDTHVAQVGGKHYEGASDGLQHWDIIEQGDIAYLEATATKYLARWRKKGTPELDLKKAASYLDKALVCRPGQGVRRVITEDRVDDFLKANYIHWMDGEIIKMILSSGSRDDLINARNRILEMASGQS